MTCNNNPANGATRHNYPPGIRICDTGRVAVRVSNAHRVVRVS
jgi:hypothetical protein